MPPLQGSSHRGAMTLPPAFCVSACGLSIIIGGGDSLLDGILVAVCCNSKYIGEWIVLVNRIGAANW